MTEQNQNHLTGPDRALVWLLRIATRLGRFAAGMYFLVALAADAPLGRWLGAAVVAALLELVARNADRAADRLETTVPRRALPRRR